MKAFLLFFGLIFTSGANADVWVDSSCSLEWNHPTPELVQEYIIYINNSPVFSTPNMSATCTDLSLTQGRYEVYVTARNPSGESGASNIVPFVFTTSAPDSPTHLSISIHLSISNIGVIVSPQ